MKLGMMASAAVQASIERAHDLRSRYIAHQLGLGRAALQRLVHDMWHVAVSGKQAWPQRLSGTGS